ncbi:hypothetical protein DdX_12787 [Ditylenchus destructor]|uniref:Uncharacterized protein n=1 Tax=Ditylenchus destructor TaxID=166010 RepID=A0AAD4MUY3_9BILA|nr:hypothetical protein DdX_12787 [Ditylenchus destructor]
MSSTHLTYLNYGEAWIRVAAQFTTIALMSNIIFCALAPKRALLTVRVTLSRSLMVYLWYHAITSATSLPYNIYVVAKWHAPVSIKGINVPLYDPYWLFWTGIWPATYSSMNPVAVLILTLDRILVLSCHEWYKIRVQKLAVTFGALIIVALGVACVSLFFLELPLDLGKAVYCESFPCINLKNSSLPQLGVKLTSGVMAVVCMLWFFYLIKKYPGNLKINDRVVKITIIFEILFDVMPAFSLILFDGDSSYAPRRCMRFPKKHNRGNQKQHKTERNPSFAAKLFQ